MLRRASPPSTGSTPIQYPWKSPVFAFGCAQTRATRRVTSTVTARSARLRRMSNLQRRRRGYELVGLRPRDVALKVRSYYKVKDVRVRLRTDRLDSGQPSSGSLESKHAESARGGWVSGTALVARTPGPSFSME